MILILSGSASESREKSRGTFCNPLCSITPWNYCTKRIGLMCTHTLLGRSGNKSLARLSPSLLLGSPFILFQSRIPSNFSRRRFEQLVFFFSSSVSLGLGSRLYFLFSRFIRVAFAVILQLLEKMTREICACEDFICWIMRAGVSRRGRLRRRIESARNCVIAEAKSTKRGSAS